MVRPYVEQERRESIINARNDDRSQKRAAARNGKDTSKDRNIGDCAQVISKGRCSRGVSCSFKHDSDKELERRRKRTYQMGSDPKSSSASGKPNKRVCYSYQGEQCPHGSACDSWHPPECSHSIEIERRRRGENKCVLMRTDQARDDKNHRCGRNASIAVKSEDAQELNCVLKDGQGSTSVISVACCSLKNL